MPTKEANVFAAVYAEWIGKGYSPERATAIAQRISSVIFRRHDKEESADNE